MADKARAYQRYHKLMLAERTKLKVILRTQYIKFIQLLFLDIIHRVLFLFKTHNVSDVGSVSVFR
jgi:hypothetical protein